MYSREQIDKVRSAVDIVETIRLYVPSLTASGRSVKGLCPFHHERTPSFHVQPDKGFFKCFGCGEAGDVITFVAKIENATFVEALEKLAAMAGVVLQKDRGDAEPRQDDVKEKLYRVLDAAASIYRKVLLDSVLGKPGRVYLEERGVGADTQERFALGLAPSSGPSVFEQLVAKGFSFELCRQAGLAARSKSGRFYDPLFGRLIFPIWDGFGHTVGFGGRILPEAVASVFGDDDVEQKDGPKYINSPESPVFQKGRLLYGLNQGKPAILKDRRALLMEGYMDVIGAHQAGYTTAVATLGTAFTRDHAKLLKRYADKAVLFFDFDEAGRRAVIKSLEPLIAESLFPTVVVAESNLDPDEILLQNGPDYFEGLLKKAPDFVDYLTTQLLKDGRADLQKKNEAVKFILPLIAASPNELLRSEWLERLALLLGVNRRALEEMAGKNEKNVEPAPVRRAAPLLIPSAEDEILQLLFSCPVVWGECRCDESHFSQSRQRVLFRLMKTQVESGGGVSFPSLFDQMPDDDKPWLQQLLLEEKTVDDPPARLQQLEQGLFRTFDKQRLSVLAGQLKAGGLVPAAVKEEYQQLLKRVKGSK